MTREDWLENATSVLESIITRHGGALPENVKVSCSWPVGSVRKVIGQAWSAGSSAEGFHETLVSPILDDPIVVLSTLLHELVHHAVGVEHGHKAPFKRLAVACGLAGKMTETYAGEGLTDELHVLAEHLGPYPHAAVTPTRAKKAATRLIKCMCHECGYVIRTTNKWLEYGTPMCPCNGDPMEREN